MNVLVFGGTVFLGRHVVDALQARGHAVTLFNRGRTRPELFADVEQLRGERDGKLDALAVAVHTGRRWDAVIDCCGFVPRVVRQSAELLRDATDRYLFVSSISVYADHSRPGTTEDDALVPLADPASEDVPRDYGALKAMCEREVAAACGERAINVRPGLIVGPWDPTGRFTYWVHRAALGGEMLAPDRPGLIIQVIDARDLAAWMVHLVESRASGKFNATGPVGSTCDFGALIDVCIDVGNAGTQATWVDGAFLLEHKVAPWTELPVWVPPEDGGLLSVDLRRASAAGLVTRALVDTVRDTLAWRFNTPDALRNERVPGAGFSASAKRNCLRRGMRATRHRTESRFNCTRRLFAGAFVKTRRCGSAYGLTPIFVSLRYRMGVGGVSSPFFRLRCGADRAREKGQARHDPSLAFLLARRCWSGHRPSRERTNRRSTATPARLYAFADAFTTVRGFP